MSIKARVQALLDDYARAYSAGDADGCAAVFTGDAVVYSPYAEPARGRAAIAELHGAWVGHGGAKTMTVLQAESSGDLGWCLAGYSEGAETGNGTSLNILARQPDGSWLIRMSSLSADEPPLAAA